MMPALGSASSLKYAAFGSCNPSQIGGADLAHADQRTGLFLEAVEFRRPEDDTGEG
jgi:hypothetical protein